MRPAADDGAREDGARDSETLRRRLEQATGSRVALVLTKNRTRVASARRRPGGLLEIRLHEALADATIDEIGGIAAFATGRSGGRAALRRLMRSRRDELERAQDERPPRPVRVDAVGRVHDLEGLLDGVRTRLLESVEESCPELAGEPGALDGVRVSWSGTPGRARRRIRLGAWDETRRVVRVHRRLDARDVPAFFVRSVLHHELCHALLGPPPVVGGRRVLHGPDFRRLERLFPEADRADEWERAHVARLLRR